MLAELPSKNEYYQEYTPSWSNTRMVPQLRNYYEPPTIKVEQNKSPKYVRYMMHSNTYNMGVNKDEADGTKEFLERQYRQMAHYVNVLENWSN